MPRGPRSRHAELPGYAELPSIIKNRFAIYVMDAERRGVVFDLTIAEFLRITGESCLYCGTPPGTVHRANGIKDTWTYNGIDRLDSGKGYTRMNSVACCWQCNHHKSTIDHVAFLRWIRRVATHQGWTR